MISKNSLKRLGFVALYIVVIQTAISLLCLFLLVNLDANEKIYDSEFVRALFPHFNLVSKLILFVGIALAATLWLKRSWSLATRMTAGTACLLLSLAPAAVCNPEITMNTLPIPGVAIFFAMAGTEPVPQDFWKKFTQIRSGISQVEAERALGAPKRVIKNEEGKPYLLQYILSDDGGWRLGLRLDDAGRVSKNYIYYWID